jgi:hypothetical protein
MRIAKRNKSGLSRISRAAAIRVTLSVALILGASCLVLQSTVWHNNEPAEADQYYTELPGVDLKGLQPEEKEALLERLNKLHCPCDCLRTIASCRNRHTSCTMSLAIARQAVEAAKKH